MLCPPEKMIHTIYRDEALQLVTVVVFLSVVVVVDGRRSWWLVVARWRCGWWCFLIFLFGGDGGSGK